MEAQELSAAERRRVRAAAWISVLAYLNVAPASWLAVIVAREPRPGVVIGHALCLVFAAVFAVYWTSQLRLILARCFAFTRADGPLVWGARLSALSAVPFMAEPVAQGWLRTGLHAAGSILSILSLALLFHAAVVLREMPGTLFGLKRWFLPCWLALTGGLLVLVALGSVLPTEPDVDAPLGLTAAMVSLLAGLAVVLTGIPVCVMSVLIFLRAARGTGPARPPP